jgi:hypothetical protein
MTMDLREFVHGALKDVVLGIQDAQQEEGIGGYIAPKSIGGHEFPKDSGVSFRAHIVSTVMKFDVAVTAERGKQRSGAAAVRIAVVEAKLGGEGQSKDTTVSRVQFAVPILMPTNPQEWSKVESPPTTGRQGRRRRITTSRI